MSETPKTDPETLVLRSQPRKIVRFRRSLLIGAAAFGAIVIFGAAIFGLRGTALVHRQNESEFFRTGQMRLPDVMAVLPSSYDHIRLGAPLPGDLAKPVVEREQAVGVNPSDTSFKPNPQDDAVRAERIRLFAQARQADEAQVFFTIAATRSAPALPPADNTKAAGLNLDPTRDPNNQGHKLDMLNAPIERDVFMSHSLQQAASPFELLAGTVISASLITGLNSDLPGPVIAQLTQDLYDSVTGSVLLVPRGSKLIGTYDSVVAFGQKRAFVVWQRIVMPNGSSIQIDNQPATDQAGYVGLEDDVDYHTWMLLKGIALSSLLGVATQATFANANSDLVQAIRQSTQESTNQAGQQIVQKDLAVQPTLTVRPGWPLSVLLSKDIVLKPYEG